MSITVQEGVPRGIGLQESTASSDLSPIIIDTGYPVRVDTGMADLAASVAAGSEEATILNEENLVNADGAIIVANHYVTSQGAPLEDKWHLSLRIMDAVGKTVGRNLSEGKRVMWAVATLPRSASIGSGTILGMDSSRFDAIREQFLRNAPDVIPVAYTPYGERAFLDQAGAHLERGDALCIFPEARTSHSLVTAEQGFSHLAIRRNSPVYPVAVYEADGQLTIAVGSKEEPPREISQKGSFAARIMGRLAEMLPEDLGGVYSPVQS